MIVNYRVECTIIDYHIKIPDIIKQTAETNNINTFLYYLNVA